jgi:uncharacterized protein Veg
MSVERYMPKNFVAGDLVVGIKGEVLGHKGQIIEVLTTSGRRKFKVRWTNGLETSCFVNSLQLEGHSLNFQHRVLPSPSLRTLPSTIIGRLQDDVVNAISSGPGDAVVMEQPDE